MSLTQEILLSIQLESIRNIGLFNQGYYYVQIKVDASNMIDVALQTPPFKESSNPTLSRARGTLVANSAPGKPAFNAVSI
jgi:hypothetical protein